MHYSDMLRLSVFVVRSVLDIKVCGVQDSNVLRATLQFFIYFFLFSFGASLTSSFINCKVPVAATLPASSQAAWKSKH